MKYRGFKYFIDLRWFVIFPTITILKDQPQYLDKNFSIQFHWLGFHSRWFWIKELNTNINLCDSCTHKGWDCDNDESYDCSQYDKELNNDK